MPPAVGVLYMKHMTILGIFALVMLLVLPGAVSAADVQVSGSILPEEPVASFSATPTAGAETLTVYFTDASTPDGYIDAWTWEYRETGTVTWILFDDSAEQNPTQDFNAGYYDIRLTVSNAAGNDEEIKENYIHVSPGPLPLETVQSGTVSGDLYVGAFQDPGFSDQTQYGENIMEPTFTLPSYTDIEWARLYVVVYAAGTDDREGTATISFDANGDGDYLDTGEILGVETLATAATSAADVYPVNDHVDRQYSDYRLWYDVTSIIDSQSPTAKVVSTPVATNFDARIKTVTLVVAYNDGDDDVIQYWINEGHDYQSSSATTPSSTTFDTNGIDDEWTEAILTNVALSSADATYTFNENSIVGADPVSPIGYFENNVWDVDGYLTSDSDSSFTYLHASGSYKSFKTILATLKVKYTAPTADFHADKINVVIGETVTFTDDSTGSVNSWAWDFDNDGTVDSTDQNPTWTYTTAGQKTVKLTVSGPLGSDYETKTDYITVGEAIIEVTVDPATISFGTMAAGDTKTGSTAVDVDVTYGTDWYVTASASNGGYMGTGSANLATPFQLSNDGTNFQEMTSNFANFMTGAAGVDGSDTADVKQVIDAADAPGSYSITLTFTGGFEI